MSKHKEEEKEMQAFIDVWAEDNKDNYKDIKMVPKTLKVERKSTVYQTYIFDVILPEASDDEWVGHDVVDMVLCQGFSFGTPDEEDYDSCDDEYVITNRAKR